ncbi:MAG: OmpA family protein [Bacteroidota bacterium]
MTGEDFSKTGEEKKQVWRNEKQEWRRKKQDQRNEKDDWKLKIAGHTDNVGTSEFNMQLSKARAESVREYLISRGLKASRFIIEYYGETKPIDTNDTEEGRQKNRRVEMIFIFE